MHNYFIVAALAVLTIGYGGPLITDMMTDAITVQLEMQTQQLENLKHGN